LRITSTGTFLLTTKTLSNQIGELVVLRFLQVFFGRNVMPQNLALRHEIILEAFLEFKQVLLVAFR
jgi:hypothetical protein